MKTILLRKLLSSLVVVFLLTILIFLIIHLIPGDAVTVILGDRATTEQAQVLRAQYNLDKPLVTQYSIWLGNVLKGHWGNSLMNGTAAMPQVLERLPRTLLLCVLATGISLLIAVLLGVVSAAKHNTNLDLGISGGSLLLLSIPEFWMGMLLMILLSVTFSILPAGGYVSPMANFGEFIQSLILPVVTLVISLTPSLLRLVRGSMLEVLGEDYIMLARTKGNSSGRVNFVHALRNSLIPVSTAISLLIASLMAGVIVIEKVFQYPGMGLLLLNSIQRRDYPLIQAGIFVFSIIVVVTNLITDMIYTIIDPRIRYN